MTNNNYAPPVTSNVPLEPGLGEFATGTTVDDTHSVSFLSRELGLSGRRDKGYKADEVDALRQEADQKISELQNNFTLSLDKIQKARDERNQVAKAFQELKEKHDLLLASSKKEDVVESLTNDLQQSAATIKTLKQSLAAEQQANNTLVQEYQDEYQARLQANQKIEELQAQLALPPAPPEPEPTPDAAPTPQPLNAEDIPLTPELRHRILAEEAHTILALANNLAEETIANATIQGQNIINTSYATIENSKLEAQHITQNLATAQNEMNNIIQHLNTHFPPPNPKQ